MRDVKPVVDTCAAVDALLLDYAYGELEGAGRRKVEDHLSACARCRTALVEVAQTRHAMAALTPEPAPEAGLDSLLAYAEQAAAQRVAARQKPSSSWRWLVPALSVAGASAAVLLLVSGPRNSPQRALPAPATAVSSGVERAAPMDSVRAASTSGTGADRDEKARLAGDIAARPEKPATGKAQEPPSFAKRLEKTSPAKAGASMEGSQAMAEMKAGPASDSTALSQPQAGMALGQGRLGSREPTGAGATNAYAPRPTEPSREEVAEAAKESQGLAQWEERQPFEAEADRRSAKDEARSRPKSKSGGEATGNPAWPMAAAQTPIRGAIADDEYQGVLVAEQMSNIGMPSPKPAAKAPAGPPAPSAPSTVFSASEPSAAPTPAAASRSKKKDGAFRQSGGEAGAGTGLASDEALLRLAQEQSDAGDLAGAEATYARFLQQFATHPRALEASLARASLLERLQRAAEAAAVRQEIARRWPNSAKGGAVGRGAASPLPSRAAPMERALDTSDRADPAAAAH